MIVEFAQSVVDLIMEPFRQLADLATQQALAAFAWALELAASVGLAAPSGAEQPVLGEPVSTASWRPWQHFLGDMSGFGFVDQFLPLQELLGAALFLGALWFTTWLFGFLTRWFMKLD